MHGDLRTKSDVDRYDLCIINLYFKYMEDKFNNLCIVYNACDFILVCSIRYYKNNHLGRPNNVCLHIKTLQCQWHYVGSSQT
jgi:hypothetical protein